MSVTNFSALPIAPAVAYIILVLSTLALLSTIVATLLFVRRRHMFPLSGRSLSQQLLYALFICCITLDFVLNVTLYNAYTCAPHALLYCFGIVGMLVLIFFRAWTVLFRLGFSNGMKLKTPLLDEEVNADSGNWYSKHAAFGKGRGFWGALAIDLLVVIGVQTSMLFRERKIIFGPRTCVPSGMLFFGMQGIFVVAHTSFFAFVACQSRKFREDSLGLRKELALLSASPLFMVAMTLVANMERKQSIGMSMFAGLLLVWSVVIVSLILPLIASYHQVAPEPSDSDALAMLISGETGRQSFFRFLQSEFSAENLLFFLAIEDLESAAALPPIQDEDKDLKPRLRGTTVSIAYDVMSTQDLETKLKEIFDNFVATYSPYEINIDGQVREAITGLLDLGSPATNDNHQGGWGARISRSLTRSRGRPSKVSSRGLRTRPGRERGDESVTGRMSVPTESTARPSVPAGGASEGSGRGGGGLDDNSVRASMRVSVGAKENSDEDDEVIVARVQATMQACDVTFDGEDDETTADARLRLRLHEALRRLGLAKLQVWHLMHTDSYPRYRRSRFSAEHRVSTRRSPGSPRFESSPMVELSLNSLNGRGDGLSVGFRAPQRSERGTMDGPRRAST